MRDRKLFCEISPWTYRISTAKCRFLRHYHNLVCYKKYARHKTKECLPVCVYKHNSLIRRKLGDVDAVLQENKSINLGLAAPKINHILICPNETFSFWQLVGKCTAAKGYQEGLAIKKGVPDKDIGGGMCQFTNLIHWLVLHSELTITEYHHHDNVDLFPDFGRVVPFGVGTSILYNYLDYQFTNNTSQRYQLVVYVDETYLHGELRCQYTPSTKIHIRCENEYFSQKEDAVFRNSEIYKEVIDVKTGNKIARNLVKTNRAKVLYNPSNLRIQSET